MENNLEAVPNGAVHTPRTQSINGLSLTEYTANPSPPREGREDQNMSVPIDFRQPDGHPDVRASFSHRKFGLKSPVSTLNSHIKSLRSR